MMESLILLLLSSGLYRANHGTAMTAHANRGFGAVGWNGMPVPSRAWRSRRARDAPFAAQRGVTRAAALQPRYDVPAAAGGIIRTGRRRVGEGGGSCLEERRASSRAAFGFIPMAPVRNEQPAQQIPGTITVAARAMA
jgi:hypothetical protein